MDSDTTSLYAVQLVMVDVMLVKKRETCRDCLPYRTLPSKKGGISSLLPIVR